MNSNKIETHTPMDNDLIQIYYNRFLIERVKLRYIELRSRVTNYAMEYCISDFDKTGLTESEIECIKNRTHTFITYYKNFNFNQRKNFNSIYKENI